jgi:hypothetical protein
VTRGRAPDPTEPIEEDPVTEHDHDSAHDVDPGDAADGSTGDATVDDALARLRELDGLPVREHVGVFEAVHASLQGRLADVED